MPTPLTLESSSDVIVTTAPVAWGITVEPVPVVAVAVPTPTLVNGRPQ